MRVLKKPKKYKNSNNIKKNFFTLDVETTKLEPQPKNFVFCVLYGWNFKKVFYSIKDLLTELQKNKYKKKYIFAHNAEFDLLTIFGNIYQNLDNSAIFNGSFITAKYNDIILGDSMNIFPSSVSKIGETIGLKKLDNEKIKKAGLNKNNITDNDIKYCIRDCEIIFTALLEIFEHIGAIKLTISSISMYNFRNEFLENDIYFSDLVDEFYESYYGGRTEAFKIGKVNAKVFDINSLYPYVMEKMLFPDVKNLKKESKIDLKYFNYVIKNYEGMAKIKVLHKDSYFGFLPYRNSKSDSKNKKLLFPIGIFTTTINFNELRFALSYNIIEILEVNYIIYSNPIKSPFKKFINENYNLRINSDNSLTKLIYKLKMNSLYGRFAMRMKLQTTYYDLIPYELIEELEKTNKYHELKIFNQIRSDCFLITENEKFKNSFFSIPTFSSYITSEARIILLKSLIDNQNNNVVYCDTDSIFLENNFIGTINDNLGNWKDENKTVIEIKGLKNYVTQEKNGTIIQTIKGVSKNAEKISSNTYKKIQYYKTKESLRQNKEAGSKKIVIKEISNKYDKRIVLKDGNTKPLKLNEI